jgi:hypothetical protein
MLHAPDQYPGHSQALASLLNVNSTMISQIFTSTQLI